MIVDGLRVSVGSTNLDGRSLSLNDETDPGWGTPRSPVPSAGLRPGAPRPRSLLEALAQPEKRQDGDDDDDYADDVDDVGHDLLLRVR